MLPRWEVYYRNNWAGRKKVLVAVEHFKDCLGVFSLSSKGRKQQLAGSQCATYFKSCLTRSAPDNKDNWYKIQVQQTLCMSAGHSYYDCYRTLVFFQFNIILVFIYFWTGCLCMVITEIIENWYSCVKKKIFWVLWWGNKVGISLLSNAIACPEYQLLLLNLRACRSFYCF